jgi:hypothetical protein
MSSENTALWDNLGRTDPKHTKGFTRGGGFKGTAIKPMWSYLRMTEEFGPCGTGWGVGEPTFQVVPGDNREVLVYCTASIWYRRDNAEARVYGVGGDKVVSYIKANEQYNRPERWESDDEAFKKAFTDAVTNALKLIGVGADVHMGLFDDNKYVNTMREEFADDKPGEPRPGDGRSTYVKEHRAGEERRQEAANTSRTSSAQLKRENVWPEFQADLHDCDTTVKLQKLAMEWSQKAEKDGWPETWKSAAHDEINAHRKQLLAKVG